MDETPGFTFDVDADAEIASRLVLGFASPGMAGLVATDHLVSERQTVQVGHADARNLSTVTPFTDGRPRRAIRLYQTDADLSILLSELSFPPGVGDRFADAVVTLASEHGIDEITIPYGVSYPHDPQEHAVFSVSTDDYDTQRLRDAGISPLSGGFLDGGIGRLLQRGMDDATPAVGTLVTPAHPPGPDFDGALLLLDAVGTLTGIDIDTSELEARSEEVRRHYSELADRMEALSEERAVEGSEDWMYM